MLSIDNKLLYKISGILIVALLLSGVGCSNDSAELASYDGGNIDQTEFLSHYQQYLSVTGLPDNLPDRKKVLRSALHEELILKDWHTKKLDDDPISRQILNRQAEQAILDTWWAHISETDKEPSPEVLAQMLINEKSRFHLQESHYADFHQDCHQLNQYCILKAYPQLLQKGKWPEPAYGVKYTSYAPCPGDYITS